MKTIWISFPQGGLIPGSILGKTEDVEVPALEPVEVPYGYGKHLIDDRFAVRSDPKAPSAGAGKADKKAVAAAEKAVAEAKAELTAAGNDDTKKAAAEEKLTAAEAELAALKASA